MYSIEYLPTTHSDFNDIVYFYGNILKNKKYAVKITTKIRTKIKNLKSSPESCGLYEFTSRNPKYPSPDIYVYRKLIVGYYIVLYVIDYEKNIIKIVRILDGRSDYQNKI